MKHDVLLILWVASAVLTIRAADPIDLPVPPVVQSALMGAIQFDLESEVKLEYRVFVSQAPNGVFTVSYQIRPSLGANLVRQNPSVIPFEMGEHIGLQSPAYQTVTPNLQLNEFRQQEVFPVWFYTDLRGFSPEPFFTNKTSILIGFRADLEDGRHYGWLKFSRPDILFPRPFTLDAWDWNPVPDLPIPAGLPPQIPLSGVVAKNESEQPVLRLSWPQAVSAWTLESTTNLAPPIQWEYYPTGGPGVDVPLTSEGEPQRYFRLRKP